MFKDYHKYLSTSLIVYIFVLIVIFIMKIVGLDYFGLDYETILKIDEKINIFPLNYMINFTLLIIQLYFLTYIITLKKPKIFELSIVTLINILLGLLVFILKIDFLYSIISFLILIVYFKIKGSKFKKIFKVLVINIILQIISTITRNNTIVEYNFALSLILDIDYMLMLLIYYEIVKEGKELCQYQIHGLSLLKKIHLSTLPKKLQKKLLNFKQLDKETRITYIIYFILSFIWNIATIILILFVAKLNNTLIECLFILTSFWLSKGAFGKSFHLPSMIQCFIISNLTYYCLNRITTSLGISIFIPILLGVGLSYFTSKLVKKTYKPLYKGMPKELFEETILKVTDKESIKYKICYDFFINNKNALYLTGKYNYSEAGIRQIISRINKQIKDLK